MRGYFITFEGGEGAGKSSILREVGERFSAEGYQVTETREPGGIEIAEQIREIVLNPGHTAMDSWTEALLYAAARRQHLVEKVIPALEAGHLVLCDRFVDSSLAYQGCARALGMEEIWKINEVAIQGHMPDITVLFDIEPEKGLQRITENKQREQNRLDLEKMHFHQHVHQAYRLLHKKFPERIKVVNAEQPFSVVAEETYRLLAAFLAAGHPEY